MRFVSIMRGSPGLVETVVMIVSIYQACAVVKYNITEHIDQLIKVVHESKDGFKISGLEVNLSPSNFDYFVPFTVSVKCGDGILYVEGMNRIRSDQIYMEARSNNESWISFIFNVKEMPFKYNLCWLNVVLPIPIWLQGKLINSNYHVTGRVHYHPECQFFVEKADLLSYKKMSLNIFKWLPGTLEDWFMEKITRKSEEEILKTVTRSMHYAVQQLTEMYNPCVIFPAMGRMTPIQSTEEEENGGGEDFYSDPNSGTKTPEAQEEDGGKDRRTKNKDQGDKNQMKENEGEL